MPKKIIVEFDKNGTATCIGGHCYYYTTYFWWGDKKLAVPIVRCCSKKCFLDNKSTEEVNKQFEEWYPVRYKKPIKELNSQSNENKKEE